MVPSIVNNLKIGDRLETLAWHKDVVTILTMKKSVIENYETCPSSYDEYREGVIAPGVVTQIKPYGVFLRLPNLSKAVLCPTRMLQVQNVNLIYL